MPPRRPASRPVRETVDLDWEGTPVRLVRSTARTRTVSAVWREGRLQVSVPARLSRAEEREWISRMVERAGAAPAPAGPTPPTDGGAGPDPSRPRTSTPGASSPATPDPGASAPGDAALLAWARRVSDEHYGGEADPVSVTWSTRQRHRWGSCTPARRTIRLSAQLRGMPDWVVEAVLVHEVAHLLESGHGPRFQRLVARHPRYAEAMAFLAGVTYAQGRGLAAGPASADDDVAAPGWGDDVEGG